MTPFTYTASCDPGSFFIRIYLGKNNEWFTGETKQLNLTFWNTPSTIFQYHFQVITGLQEPHAIAGDYDGDGIADISVYDQTTGIWKIKQSTDGQVLTKLYGTSNTDRFVVGDFDGDLKDDFAVYRPSAGVWFYIRSSDNTSGALALGIPNVTFLYQATTMVTAIRIRPFTIHRQRSSPYNNPLLDKKL